MEDMMEDSFPTKLIDALVKAQEDMQHATDNAANPHFNSKYATLEQVIDTVKPILAKHKIMFQQISHDVHGGGVAIETIFYGHGSEFRTGIVKIPLDKNTCQGYGSALTYCRRYSLSLACGIGSEKDDDGNKAESFPKKIIATSKKPNRSDVEYQLLTDSGKVVAETKDASHFFDYCKRHLKDPQDIVCRKIYQASEKYINLALTNSPPSLQERYKNMITAYGGDL